MIPEYKFYHGAVLCELIDAASSALLINELVEEGRLASYIINQSVGVQIKHSTARLPPWNFTLTKANVEELYELRKRLPEVFLILVCDDTGMLSLSIIDLLEIIHVAGGDQAWIRVTRKRRGRFQVFGSAGPLKYRKKMGVLDVLKAAGVKTQVNE